MAEQTLGERIRAARMRFGWSALHKCYVRLTYVHRIVDVGGVVERIQVELAPPGLVPNERRNDVEHVIWYDRSGQDMEVLTLCSALDPYIGKGVDRFMRFDVDDDGKRIGE